MSEKKLNHPVLGQLEWDERVAHWRTDVDLLPGNEISLRIAVEEDWEQLEPQALFEIAAAFLDRARQAEGRIRDVMADDMHEVYNDYWADEDPDEGCPPMDRPAFLASIRPDGITLHHDGSSSWTYDCGELFGGHVIYAMFEADWRPIGEASLYG